MLRKFLAATLFASLGTFILVVSIFRSAAIHYSFSPKAENRTENAQADTIVDYELPSPGSILPDNPLWILKGFRDRVWLFLTPEVTRRAELNLLFADKRLVTAKILIGKEKYDLGVLSLLKAERYLETASQIEEAGRKKGIDTRPLLEKITISSLKHREIIDELISLSPLDAKPEIIKIKDITKEVFVRERNGLQEVGLTAPKCPSEWD